MALKRTVGDPSASDSLVAAEVKAEIQANQDQLVAGASMFGKWGGDGSDGDPGTISSATNFSAIDNASRPGFAQFTVLNIASDTLTVDTGFMCIGVSGTCTIAGTIDAIGQGSAGGAAQTNLEGKAGLAANGFGSATWVTPGIDMDKADGTWYPSTVAQMFQQYKSPFCLTGPGGGGGGGSSYNGGFGGGAGGNGGEGANGAEVGYPAYATTTRDILIATSGLGDNVTKGYSHFIGLPWILRYLGAGGGGGGANGNTGGAGGAGGGVVYIECDTLVGAGGTVACTGGAGGNGAADTGGGGGGGGGLVLIRAKTVTSTVGTVIVTAGAAGAGGAGGYAGGAGGAGYKNVIQVN